MNDKLDYPVQKGVAEVSNLCMQSRVPDANALARVWDALQVVAVRKGESLLFRFDDLRSEAVVRNKTQWKAIMSVLSRVGAVEPYLDCGEWYWWKVSDWAQIKLKDFRHL